MPTPVPPLVQLPASTTTPQKIEAPPEIIPPAEPPPSDPVEFPTPQPRIGPKQSEPERPRRRVITPAPVQSEAVPVPAPSAPAPKVPQLAPLISDEQRRTYDAAIDALISRTGHNVARARGRTLTTQQHDMLIRAEAFLSQAQEMRKVDPAASKSLAERAELLSRHAAEQ